MKVLACCLLLLSLANAQHVFAKKNSSSASKTKKKKASKKDLNVELSYWLPARNSRRKVKTFRVGKSKKGKSIKIPAAYGFKCVAQVKPTKIRKGLYESNIVCKNKKLGLIVSDRSYCRKSALGMHDADVRIEKTGQYFAAQLKCK